MLVIGEYLVQPPPCCAVMTSAAGAEAGVLVSSVALRPL